MARKKKQALKWRKHRVKRSRANSVRPFTAGVCQRVLCSPSLPPTAEQGEIQFPELPPDPRDKAIRLLQVAAEVEHALMIQYLYSGYGFRRPNSDTLGIAVEEMAHLMMVQNLLQLIGAKPHLDRQDFGISGEDESLFPFDLKLEPLSKQSLAKYIIAESPENIPDEIDPAVMAIIVNEATAGAGQDVNRVGVLYALLGAVFGSEQLLADQAASGDSWYVAVSALAAEAAAFYGGRNRLHLTDDVFDPASSRKQGTDHDWDRTSPVPAFDEFRVSVMTDRHQAVDVLRDIGLQGEGPTSSADELSHFQRFYNLFITHFGPDGTGTTPPQFVLPVPHGAVIIVDEHSTDPQAISHPDTVRWAKLADLRYGILLASLDLYLQSPSADREALRGWCFAEMSAIRQLAQFLSFMPRAATPPPDAPRSVAGIPFNLPDWSDSSATWSNLADVLTAACQVNEDIQAAASTQEFHKHFLHAILFSDRRKLSAAVARANGQEFVRTKADRAREILDWAAGAGTPGHAGESPGIPFGRQGRFWNLPLDEFKQTNIGGSNIIEDPDGSGPEESLILSVLKIDMPMGRPLLDQTGEEFRFLEAWINAGCPDEPA